MAKGLRYANAKRGLWPQLPRLCDRELLEIRTVNDFQALLLLLALLTFGHATRT
ncbi:hypothetical protein [Moorena sp. SIO3I6]|uniref:hypothetical protein n=1 Tax=Moorena sp. SIO3I6 TaxID=2607831 RepID=UPI0013F6C9E3|nr:hypothetical protein [Moorena sp. SIO3I6]NEP29550.1 hypothetical protein [Moorena sp. SIO3I6]